MKRFKVKIVPYDDTVYHSCIHYSYGHFTFWRRLKDYRSKDFPTFYSDLQKVKLVAYSLKSIEDVRLFQERAKKSVKEKRKTIIVCNKTT